MQRNEQIKAKEIEIQLDDYCAVANLTIPDNTKGVVIFCHDYGGSRHSLRNNYIAKQLHLKGFATLLPTMQLIEEDLYYNCDSDIKKLTSRFIGITSWVLKNPSLKNIPIAYFGSGKGAAIVMNASLHFPNIIKCIVARSAKSIYPHVKLKDLIVPVLLICGSKDCETVLLNQRAMQYIFCTKKLEIINGASYSFEEHHSLKIVAEVGINWIKVYTGINNEVKKGIKTISNGCELIQRKVKMGFLL